MSEILDIHGVLISDVWAAEFRGFFLGEGSLQIHRTHLSKQYGRGKVYEREFNGFRPIAAVTQRSDNRPVLDAMCIRLGGNVSNHNRFNMVSGGNGKTYLNHSQAMWKVVATDDVRRILELLKGGWLPHTKLREIEIMERYLDIRPRTGHKMKPETREEIERLFWQIREVREYH